MLRFLTSNINLLYFGAFVSILFFLHMALLRQTNKKRQCDAPDINGPDYRQATLDAGCDRGASTKRQSTFRRDHPRPVE